ncbi:MAG: BLUF domain-containing protein [Gammaproteobacteria bacterium]|nr:BLUF domain-containing protein [Gammaproteobacteria bacterium]
MSLISVVYISTANSDFSDGQLKGLLETARHNNAALDLTGMLLYHDRTFIQVLEGPEEHVAKMYEKIGADPRHHGIVQLLRRDIGAREFDTWAMGFESISRTQLESSPDWVGLRGWDGSGSFLAEPGMAHRLLVHFHARLAA